MWTDRWMHAYIDIYEILSPLIPIIQHGRTFWCSARRKLTTMTLIYSYIAFYYGCKSQVALRIESEPIIPQEIIPYSMVSCYENWRTWVDILCNQLLQAKQAKTIWHREFDVQVKQGSQSNILQGHGGTWIHLQQLPVFANLSFGRFSYLAPWCYGCSQERLDHGGCGPAWPSSLWKVHGREPLVYHGCRL